MTPALCTAALAVWVSFQWLGAEAEQLPAASGEARYGFTWRGEGWALSVHLHVSAQGVAVGVFLPAIVDVPDADLRYFEDLTRAAFNAAQRARLAFESAPLRFN